MTSLCYKADKERSKQPVTTDYYTINLEGNPNSCIINIKTKKFRSLVDSGAEVSLLHHKIYKSLTFLPKLTKKEVHLQSVNGNSLNVLGCVKVDFSIKSYKMSHVFYVVADMNRNIILGRDWLVQNGVRLYYDLGCLRVGNIYTNLEEDITFHPF